MPPTPGAQAPSAPLLGPPALAGGELCGKPEGMLTVRKESSGRTLVWLEPEGWTESRRSFF